MAEEDGANASDRIVTEFNTYEEFLDSQITPLDLYYLEDEELARQLVELGYRGSGEVLKREEFEARKAAAEANKQTKKVAKSSLASLGKDLKEPLLIALAQREEANRSGKMTTIVFLRDKNAKGQEISGYIDYAHRLKTEDFEPYFNGKKKLLARPSDLSFYNWETHTATSNPTANYTVIAENQGGLLFKNKRDRKILNVDPSALNPGDNSVRTVLTSPKYLQAGTEVEETLKRLQSHKGVMGIIVINSDGIPIRTTLDNSTTVQYAGLIHHLTAKARAMVRDVDPTDNLCFLRVRSKKHEIMIAPDNEYILICIQNAESA